MNLGDAVFASRATAAVRHRFDEAVMELAWSPAGGVLAAASLGGEVAIVAPSGPLEELSVGTGGAVVALSWSPGGDVLAVAAEDGSLALWRPGAPAVRTSMGVTVDHLAWSGDGRIAVGGADRLVVLSGSGRTLCERTVRPGAATVVAWAGPGGGDAVVAAGVGGAAEYPVPLEGGPVVKWRMAAVTVVAVEPAGGGLAAGTIGGELGLLGGPEPEDTVTVGVAEGPVTGLGWSPDSRLVAVVADGCLGTWAVDRRRAEIRPAAKLQGHDDWVTAAAFSPVGPLLASTGLDGRVVLWAPGETADPLERLSLCGELSALAWRADGRALAAGGANGEVFVVDCREMARA